MGHAGLGWGGKIGGILGGGGLFQIGMVLCLPCSSGEGLSVAQLFFAAPVYALTEALDGQQTEAR